MTLGIYCVLLVLVCYFLYVVSSSALKSLVYTDSLDKKSAYECGYSDMNPVGDYFYTIQFFFIGVSFMLFDLEILLIVPFIVLKQSAFLLTVEIFLIFILLVLLVTLYEIYSGFLSF